jgi:branched-chain amino acid transport system substrate-binding protein
MVLATGVALSLVAAACGGDDDDTAEPATTQAPATTVAPATTEAPATTTGGETTTTAEPAADAFAIDDADCPDDAKAELAAAAPIKIAFIGPQTGPLAGFGLIAAGLKAQFDKINTEENGIGGHKLELLVKDDAYDAGKSKPLAQEAIDSDKITVSLLQVGTPNVAAVRDLYEESCTPQAFVGTGFPAWGDPKNYQFTTGGILAYNTEAEIWAEDIAKQTPGAKVGLLVYNNDFGKAYQKAFTAAAAEEGLEVVSEQLHEPTSTLTNEVTTLVAAGPDVIVGATTAGFCGNLAKNARQGGFEGPIYVSATCFSSQFLGTPEVGEAATDVYGVGYLKDPTDPQYADDEAVKTYLADMAKYAPDAKPQISSVATGYNFGSLIIDVLKVADEQGLSRVSLQNAIWNTDTTLPLGYDGAVYRINGNDDAFGAEYGEIRQYVPGAGGAPGTFTNTGRTYDREGETGLYEG